MIKSVILGHFSIKITRDVAFRVLRRPASDLNSGAAAAPVSAACRSRKRLSRTVSAGQEPLERDERRAQSVNGSRPQRDRVHAVHGRPPGKLHRGGRRWAAAVLRFGRDVSDRELRLDVDGDGEHGERHPIVLRGRFQTPSDDGNPATTASGPSAAAFRRRHHRAVRVRVRVVRGRRAPRPVDLRHSTADSHLPGTVSVRPRPESRGRYPRAVPRRRAPNVWPAFRQRRAYGLLFGSDVASRAAPERRGPAAVRPGRPRQAGHHLYQHAFHHRTVSTFAAERRANRGHSSCTSQKHTRSESARDLKTNN